MSTAKVLILGFEPFAGETINPFAEIVRHLDGDVIDGHSIVSGVLPVSFTEAPARLAQLLDRHQPELVIALGQAGGRPAISLERVAINLIDARIADNDGLQPVDVPIVQDGPGAYFSGLPLKAIEAHLRGLGVPASLSLSAGTFVCNQIFYWLVHLLATDQPEARAGFVHVPWLPEQAARHPGEPGMALETMLMGIRGAIECALGTTSDLGVAGGTTH
jgi:pyroglutamyl-peptidase